MPSRTPQLARRFAAVDRIDPDCFEIQAGRLADYCALSQYHYLRNKPVTATRVFKLISHQPSIAGRFVEQPHDSRIIGILIESLPALSCALRNRALGDRYARWSDRATSARLLNQEVRCISRVVVHPQYRGLGLAVRLVREALRSPQTPYTEALAAMGRVHPFFRQAGMREYRRWPLQKDQRLIDAMAYLGLEAWRLADEQAMSRLIDSDTQASRFFKRELSRWAGRDLLVQQQLAAARDQLLCEPVYYLQYRG